jgi:hypothetical protein
MFDMTFPKPAHRPGILPLSFPPAGFDPHLPFALTLPPDPAAISGAGDARSVIITRAATLAEAMGAAIAHADDLPRDADPQILAILDRDDRLVLAAAATQGAVAWCHPVQSAAEARAVVIEASQLRAEATRAQDWQEPALAARLRHRADLLEARLVDPLWRAFAARALQIAA